MSSLVDLRSRTTSYSLAMLRFYSGLSRETSAQILGRQVLRSATSVGAQYREAKRAKSIADFISKSEGALQELDETAYWLELLDASAISTGEEIQALRNETEELISIFVSLIKRAKQNRAKN
jgi:four helix bundle protein